MKKPKEIGLLFLLLTNILLAEERGVYFYKKFYTPEPIPTFQENKHRLPVPVMADNPEWLDMYWKSWEIAFQGMKQPEAGSPLVSNWLDEAFSGQIFQWDTIFMIMFARYGHTLFPVIESLDNFYCMQLQNGYIGREYREKDGQLIHYDHEDGLFSAKGYKNTINPPLFTWAEMENFKLTGDSTRLRRVLPVLEKYAAWLHQPGKPEAKNWQENGRWSKDAIHQLFWNTPLGSGMDNTPRPAEKGSGWVEMSAQMVIMYNHLAEMCHYLQENEKARTYRGKAKEIGQNITKWCWNDSIGFYFDVLADGEQFYKKTSGGFWPLLAEITNKEQAEQLVNHLKNPQEFWRPFVFPTLSADEPEYQADGGYWRGSIWAPTNVMIIKGLEENGYHKFAHQATEKYIDAMYRVFKETGTLWENYAPEKMAPGNPAKPDFVGWTGCGPIQLLIENSLGIGMNCIDRKIDWHLYRQDRHGIKNLFMGKKKITMICSKAQSDKSKREINIDTEQGFKLTVSNDEKTMSYQIVAGKNRIYF